MGIGTPVSVLMNAISFCSPPRGLARGFGAPRTTTAALLVCLSASEASAQATQAETRSVVSSGVAPSSWDRAASSFALGARLSNFGAGAALDVRVRTAGETQLGLDLGLGRDWDVFVGGHAGHDALRLDAGLSVLTPIWRREQVSLSFGARAHVRRIDGASQTSALAQRASWAAGGDLLFVTHAGLSDRVVLRAGVVVPVVFELAPEVQPDIVGALLSLGTAIALTEQLSLTLDADAGGVFGANGDGAKFLARGTVALRFQIGAQRWLRF